MKCINCAYHYITPADKYPHCQFGTKHLVNIPMKIQAKKNWKNSGRTRTWGLTPTWAVILMIAKRGELK